LLLPLKILLILVLLFICYQDYKDRLVYWLLYPIVGVLGFGIQIAYLDYKIIILNSLINLIFITILLFITYIYTTFILKKQWLNQSIGSGDILLFIFLSFTFSFISFIILLTFSLVFSLLLHTLSPILRSYNKACITVPLAGYIALFFSVVYMASLFFNSNYLFAY
jgi:hypothetical protein